MACAQFDEMAGHVLSRSGALAENSGEAFSGSRGGRWRQRDDKGPARRGDVGASLLNGEPRIVTAKRRGPNRCTDNQSAR